MAGVYRPHTWKNFFARLKLVVLAGGSILKTRCGHLLVANRRTLTDIFCHDYQGGHLGNLHGDPPQWAPTPLVPGFSCVDCGVIERYGAAATATHYKDSVSRELSYIQVVAGLVLAGLVVAVSQEVGGLVVAEIVVVTYLS